MLKIYDGRSEFFQWDINQKLIVSDETIKEVHFSNSSTGGSLVVEVYDYEGLRVADVPNILLQEIWDIRAYAYCGERTADQATFNVVSRNKPLGYVYTETETKRFDNLDERIAANEEEITKLKDEIKNVNGGMNLTELAAKTDALETKTNELEQQIEEINNSFENGIVEATANLEREIEKLKLVNEGHTYKYTTESYTNYENAIPTNAIKYATLDKVGGMCQKVDGEVLEGSVKDIIIRGRNLWDEQWEKGFWSIGDGAANSSIAYIRSANPINVLANKTYYISSSYGSINICYYTSDGTFISYVQGNNKTFTTPSNCSYIHLSINTSDAYNNSICVNISDSMNGTYTPYVEAITLTNVIPEHIQALESINWGMDVNRCNYIDLESKKYIQKVNRVDLGSFSYQKNVITADTSWRFSALNVLENQPLYPHYDGLLCGKYDGLYSTTFKDKTIYREYNTIRLQDLSYSTADELKDALRGVYAYYEINPIEIDLSAYLSDDNFIIVDGAQVIEHITNGNTAGFTEITYQEKL